LMVVAINWPRPRKSSKKTKSRFNLLDIVYTMLILY
jgi:hypothetical protein